jgi:hypothetical protein
MTENRHVKFDMGGTSCLKEIHVIGRTFTISQYAYQNILSLEIIGLYMFVVSPFAIPKERK